MPAVWEYVGDGAVGDGAWSQIVYRRPYAKYNGVWTAARSYYVKINGVWVQQWAYDTTPPNKPELDLILVENTTAGKVTSRWIRVGVRMPTVSHDPTVSVIRVLTDYNDAAPTTPLGGTYTSEPDGDYPGEPWSDWRYDGTVYGNTAPHGDNSKIVYKQWPRNADTSTLLRGDRNYHFGAWALDDNGNWGAGTINNIYIPKGGVDEPRTIVKEATFYPNEIGSWGKVGTNNQGKTITGWKPGPMVQQQSPRSLGLLMYGGQFIDNVAGNATITKAEIYLVRENDAGSATAHLSCFWHDYGHSSALPGNAVGAAITTHEDDNLGNISKGQGKWFDLPDTYRNNIKSHELKGIGLNWKRPGAASANADDFSRIGGGGQIHMVWEEPV